MSDVARALDPDSHQPARVRKSDVIFCFSAGVFFALLQFSYFFLLEVFLSSRSTSFFVALFFWLIGFLAGFQVRVTKRYPWLLVLSGLGYYASLGLVSAFPYNFNVIPAVCVLIALSGSAVGSFFPFARDRFPKVKHLFFHENNGFIFGIVLSLIGAVFAGRWLLSFAPAGGLLVVLGMLRFPRIGLSRRSIGVKRRQGVLAPNRSTEPVGLSLLAGGVHFGILQVAVFYVVQVYLTASFLGYFAVVLAWMVGVVWSLRTNYPKSYAAALSVSALCYYALLILSSIFSPYLGFILLAAVLSVGTAMAAGTFFRVFSKRVTAASLFVQENNGFVLGYLLSLFGFFKWGVHFLEWAPLFSLAVVFLANHGHDRVVFLFLSVGALLCLQLGNLGAFWVVLAIGVVGGFGKVAGPFFDRLRIGTKARHRRWLSARTARYVLFVSGINLIFLQYLLVREFSSVLAASEVTIILVAAAYFAGFSVGYLASRILSPGVIRSIAAAMFLVHLGILLFVKVISGHLIHAGFGVEVLFGLLFLASFATAAFYSMFLPKLIEIGGGSASLTEAYSWDLAGAATGVALMFGLTIWMPNAVLPLYFLLMLALIFMVLGRSRFRFVYLLFGLSVIVFLGRFQNGISVRSTEDYFETRSYSNPKVLFAANSPYHSIEVIDTHYDEAREKPRARHSFINGVHYFSRKFDGEVFSERGSTSTSEFTYFLAELPAKLLRAEKKKGLNVLIMGCGSMYSVSAVKDFADRITLVEIDPLVVESAKKCWADLNRHEEATQLEIVFDDVKHFLRTSPEEYDLIINDISAPYYLGTALLHGVDFYRIVGERLASDGLFAESTQGRPRAKDPDSQGMKILRGVADVFDRYRLIDVHDSPRRKKSGYVYASRRFDFSSDAIEALMKRDGKEEGTTVHPTACSHFRIHRTTPYSRSNVETLLSGNLFRMTGRLKLDEGDEGKGTSSRFDRLARSLRKSRVLAGFYDALSDRGVRTSFLAVLFGVIYLGAIAVRGKGGRGNGSGGIEDRIDSASSVRESETVDTEEDDPWDVGKGRETTLT